MLELIALAGLFIAGLAVLSVVGVAFLVLKVVFWAVFFPIRLLFKLLWIPFGIIGGLLGGAFTLAAGAALLPILLVVGLIVAVLGAIAAVLALVVPAIPLSCWAWPSGLSRGRPVFSRQSAVKSSRSRVFSPIDSPSVAEDCRLLTHNS